MTHGGTRITEGPLRLSPRVLEEADVISGLAAQRRAVMLRIPRPGTAWAVLSVGLVALGVALWVQAHRYGESRVYRARNFYGVLTVFKREVWGERFLELMHGQTGHGLQFLDEVRAAWPTAYFSEKSGVGLAMSTVPAGNRR